MKLVTKIEDDKVGNLITLCGTPGSFKSSLILTEITYTEKAFNYISLEMTLFQCKKRMNKK
jgi:hypothetical protein